MQAGAEAEARASASPFRTEHAEIIGWLDVLLKGKSEDQARARTEIAMILEAQGFADDAEEAYWTNVQSKSADRRAYERLIALYQERKDRLSESLVRRQLDEVFTGPGALAPAASVQPHTFSQLNAPAALSAGSQATSASPSQPAGRPVRRLRSASQRAGAATTPERADNPRLRALPAPGAPPPETLAPARPAAAATPARPHLTPAPAPAAASAAPVKPGWRIARKDAAPAGESAPAQPAAPEVAAIQRVADQFAAIQSASGEPANFRPAAAQPATVQLTAILPTAIQPPHPGDAPRDRRYARLAPNPGRNGFRFSTGGLIVLQPATIAAFLLASVGAAMMISFVIIMFDRGGVVPVASAASQASTAAANQASTVPAANLVTASAASQAPVAATNVQVPARCTDGSVRFPGSNDARAAVVAAYKQQGIDVDAPRAGGPRLSADQASLVVGGWMGMSLMMEHAGQRPPSLVEWLDPSSDRPTLANAILSGRTLDGMLTQEEWADMRSWPGSNCEGAFTRDARNGGQMKLIERVVTK
jgi:hypothetical protein